MKQQFLDLNGLTELVTYLKKSITEQKEILPYASNKLFPSTGNVNTIYIDTATNIIYRWDESSKTYKILAQAIKSVAISESTENGKITLTVDGKKTTVPIHGLGSAAYTNSSAYSPAGHTHTKAQVGLGNVDNTADANKSVKHAITADSATTAVTATNISGQNAYTDDARHVWFSVKGTETQRAYNDNFKYNPVKNLLTTNITGSAASASNVPWTGVTGKPSTFTPSAHNHNDSTITSLNASKLFGTIDIARLPHGALERLVIVADDTARFKLTTANIQLGDTVKVTKTEKMYYVVDESKLSSEAGYSVYTAGTATSVPWSGVTGKPSTFTPSSHTHPYLSALSVSGRTITYTKGDGTTGTITTQDTWRGIQNNLTSDSTSDSLSAAQGKVLKGLVDGKLSLSGGILTGRLTIKGDAANSPLVVRGIAGYDGNGNIGPLYLQYQTNNVIYLGNTAAYNISADGSLYSGTAANANAVPWSGITGKPTTYPPSSHTHNYAGSSSSGGIAWNANALYLNPQTRQTSANYDLTNSNTYAYRINYSLATSTMTTGKPPADGHILTFGWDSDAGYGAQLCIGNAKDNHLYLRGSSSLKDSNNKNSSSWENWKTVLDSTNYNVYAPTKTGAGASGTWGISVTGNAATATKLATARSINGTNFDGSGNIITATWGTARNVTIGSTKKSVNGGADVSWSLGEIGAAAASHSHSYLPLSGGTMSGTAMISWPDSGNWNKSNANVIFPVIRGGLSWDGQSDGIQLYAVETGHDNLELYLKFTDDNSNGLSIRNKANTQTARISATGEITASKFVGNLAGTASAVPWTGVTGRPSSMPASDVYAWAKASTKPSYTKAEVGLGSVDNTADSAKSVKYATSAGSASSSTTSGSLSSAGTLDTVDKLNAFIEGGKVKYALMSAIDGLDGMIKNDGICISTPWSSTGYGHQFYINDNGYDLYHRFRNTSKVNNVDTTTWSSWKQILDSSNYNSYAPTKTGGGASGTWGINVSGNAAYPQGFQSRVTSATWGNQTGTLITDWHTSNGGDIQFRDNSGKLNVITDGFFYQNEGKNLVLDSVNYTNYAATKSHTHSYYLGAVSANGFYGMARPDGNTSDWIRTTNNGIIPTQSGSRGSGHSALGTDSWYFNVSYIDHMYSTDVKIADKVLLQYDSTNACLNFVFS